MHLYLQICHSMLYEAMDMESYRCSEQTCCTEEKDVLLFIWKVVYVGYFM